MKPVAHSADSTQTAESATETVQVLQQEMGLSAAAGTAEAVQVEVQNPVAKAKVTGQAPTPEHAEQQPAQVEVAKQESTQAIEKAQDRRELRLGEGVTAKVDKEAGVAAQAGAVTAASENSETRTASSSASRSVPEQAFLKEASGAKGEQGNPEQKGQEQQHGALAAASLGTKESTAADHERQDTKDTKTALHANILSQVKGGVVTHDGKGNGQMSIRLNPGELGELKIQVRMEDNRLKVEVQADNRVVKDLLMSNLESLKEALSGKNFTMEGFDVSTGGGGFNAPLHEERENARQQSPQRFARGAGYDGQDRPQVKYMTAEVNSLLDVRF